MFLPLPMHAITSAAPGDELQLVFVMIVSSQFMMTCLSVSHAPRLTLQQPD